MLNIFNHDGNLASKLYFGNYKIDINQIHKSLRNL